MSHLKLSNEQILPLIFREQSTVNRAWRRSMTTFSRKRRVSAASVSGRRAKETPKIVYLLHILQVYGTLACARRLKVLVPHFHGEESGPKTIQHFYLDI